MPIDDRQRQRRHCRRVMDFHQTGCLFPFFPLSYVCICLIYKVITIKKVHCLLIREKKNKKKQHSSIDQSVNELVEGEGGGVEKTLSIRF
jgi:hypothetical protein